MLSRAVLWWLVLFLVLTGLLLGPTGAVAVPMGVPPAIPDAMTNWHLQPAADEELTTYTDQRVGWAITFPRSLLQPERLTDEVTIFIAEDRATFVAVDTYLEVGSRFGNMGENLRNRARDTLSLIYGRPVIETDVIDRPIGPWQTGIAFVTARGSKGQALYRQPRRVQPTFRVFGVIYGYKASAEEAVLPTLLGVRDSFTELQAAPGLPPFRTEVIEFVPAGAWEQQAQGECWTNSHLANRANAWRCMVDNEIYDPCFSTNRDVGWVVCGASPMRDEWGFRLNLTKPLVVDIPALEPLYAWVLELADGTRCGGLAGQSVFIGDERVNFACDDDSFVLGEPEEAELWYANRVWLSDDRTTVIDSRREPIRKAWY